MPEQATVEESDVQDIIALFQETKAPLPLEALVERYVMRLKERVTAETEAATQEAQS